MPGYVYLPVPTPMLITTALALETKMNELAPGSCGATRRNIAIKGLKKWRNRLGGHGCLAGIGSTDVIYVVIHGTGAMGMEKAGADRNAASEEIDRPDPLARPLIGKEIPYAGPPAAFKTYTAKHLAKTMQKEGLSTSHKVLELLICGAGFSDDAASRAQELAIAEAGLRGALDSEVAAAPPLARPKLQERLDARVAVRNSEITIRHGTMDTAPNLKLSYAERLYDALVALGYAGIKVHAYKGDVKPGVVTAAPNLASKAFSVIASHLENQKGTYNPEVAGLKVTFG